MDLSANLALMLAAYVAAGLFTGLMAGLLGLGGGLVMIPVLNALFALQGVDSALIQHLALGTSLAVIIPTGLLSARGHALHGAVDWSVVRRIGPWVALGALLAALSARLISTQLLQGLYLVLCVWVLGAVVHSPAAMPSEGRLLYLPPLCGTGIGILSGLLGIGGGSLTTPYLLLHGRDIRTAVGSAAALGVPIALAGTLGYGVGGLGLPGRTPWSLGFVDVFAVLGLVAGSALSVRYGVALAHHIPRRMLKQLFAALVAVAMLKMLWQLLAGA